MESLQREPPAPADAPGPGEAPPGRPTAVPGEREVHGRHDRRDRQGAACVRRARQRPARAHARRHGQAGEHAARPQHRGAVRHLPHRRPRDHQRAPVVRDRLPAQAPRGRGARAGGGRPRAGHRPRRVADRRPDQPARLRPADPRRDPAALADRARVHPPGEEPGRDRRRVRPVRPGDRDRRADPDAAPPAGDLGRGRPGVQPRPHVRGAARRPAPQRLPAVRLGAAGVHRAAVRPAGGDPRARDGPAALRAHRPRELPAEDQGDADPEAGGPHDHRAAPGGPDVGIDGPAGGQRPRAAVGLPPGRPRRPARHAAARAVRLQPRRRRGPRHPHRPRRGRPRLHRAHRRARRGRRRAADRGRRGRRDVVVQRGAAGQRGEVLRLAATARRPRPRA